MSSFQVYPATAHSYELPTISGVGDVNTISSGPDNGANNNLACGFWQSMRHGTNANLIDNLLARLPSARAQPGDTNEMILAKGVGQLNIGGHGNEGLLTTGVGQNGTSDYKTNYMMSWNEYYWGPEFDRIVGKTFSMLTIWSCHSGAGEAGADFLYAIAKRINAPVRGNTGFLYSNNRCKIWQEKGAVWQVATPDQRPDAIPPPTEHIALLKGKTEAFSGASPVKSEPGVTISVETKSTLGMRATSKIQIPQEFHELIVDEIASSVEYELPGNVMGYITHSIEVTYKSGASTVLSVYNSKIIVDLEETKMVRIPQLMRSFLNLV